MERCPKDMVCLGAPRIDTGKRKVPLDSSSLHVCQSWISNSIESSLDSLAGMNPSVSGLNCYTDIAKEKYLHFPATQKWTGDIFLLNRTGESWEGAPLPNNHIISLKNKNKLKMSGLAWTSTYSGIQGPYYIRNPGRVKRLLHPRNSRCGLILL